MHKSCFFCIIRCIDKLDTIAVEEIALAQNQLERQLVAGVRAARQGNKERARELLEAVLKQDRENEQAWIWMASIVSSTREKRICLERVLKANPNNRAARAAINSMVGVIGDEGTSIDFEAMSRVAKTPLPAGSASGSASSPARATGPLPSRQGRSNIFPLLIVAAVVLGIIFLATLIIPLFTAQPAPTSTPLPTVAEVTAEITEGVEVDNSTPVPTGTFTPQSIVQSLPTRDLPTEIIIPTATEIPTEVPTETATISAISNYSLVLVGVESNFAPTLYQVSGDGTGLQPMAANFYDIDLNPSGVLAFTNETEVVLPTPTPSVTPTLVPGTTPEAQGTQISSPTERTKTVHTLFLTNISDPLNSVEISNDTYNNAFSPSISPDGQQVAFVSDADGDNEIYIYDIPSRTIFRVTNNTGINDIDPDWSPDGTQLVFSSDRKSPEHYDIYTLTLGNDVEGSIVQLTESRRGGNFQPQWSPDGSQIAFLNQDGSNSGIRVINLANGAIRELTFQSNQTYTAPSWTSDSIYVVFSATTENNGLRQIFFVNPETLYSQEVRLDGLDVLAVVPRR